MREFKFRKWDPWNEAMSFSGIDCATFFAAFEAEQNGGNDPVLMQFIGLKDKNGVEIYEGDILAAPYWHRDNVLAAPVEYIENAFWVTHDDERLMPREDLREVIGNIYENPELLAEAQATFDKDS